MPLSLRRGRVTGVVERLEGLVRLEVDGVPCVAYPALTGPVALGDDVVVNTQARDLGLGSGGFDVLYVNLTRGLGLGADPGERHRGRSHHTQGVLDLCLGEVAVGEDGEGWREACEGLPLEHMGRGPN